MVGLEENGPMNQLGMRRTRFPSFLTSLTSLTSLVFLWVCALTVVTPVFAQGRQQPTRLVVNFPDLRETFDQQDLSVYFTLLDDNNTAVNEADFDNIRVIIDGQTFPAIVQRPQTPLYLTLVIDTSGSMRPAAFEMLAAARRAVTAMPEGTFINVIRFNEVITSSGLTEDRGRALAFIDNLQMGDFNGGTCLYDAAMTAMTQLQNTDRRSRRAVILFTDGRDELRQGQGDRCSQATFDEVINAFRNDAWRTPLYTIGLQGGNNIDEGELQSLADATGGIFAVGATQRINELFTQIVRALNSQYLVEARLCLPAGNYGGVLALTANSTNLNATLEGLEIQTECTPAAPGGVQFADLHFNADDDVITFRLLPQGYVDFAHYLIEVKKDDGFLIDPPHGSFELDAGPQNIVIPAENLRGETLHINVTLLDDNGQEIDRIESDELDVPEYETAQVFIDSIDYDRDAGRLVIETSTHQPEDVANYHLRLFDGSSILVHETRRDGPPSQRLTWTEDGDIGQPLLPGDYTLRLNISGLDIPPGYVVEYDFAIEEPPPLAPLPIRFLRALVNNPPLLIFTVLFILLILYLGVRWVRRERDPRRGGLKKSEQLQKPILDFDLQELPHEPDRGRHLPPAYLPRQASIDLVLVQSPGLMPGERWTLRPGDTLLLGRNTPGRRSISLKDSKVTRGGHVLMTLKDGRLVLEDQNSSNGTFINGQRIKGRAYPDLSQNSVELRLGMQTRFMLLLSQNKSDQVVHDRVEAFSTPPVAPLPKDIHVSFRLSAEGRDTINNVILVYRTPFWIGSATNADLYFPDPDINPYHAYLWWDDQQQALALVNNLSTTGLMVNHDILKTDDVYYFNPEDHFHLLQIGKRTRVRLSYKRQAEEDDYTHDRRPLLSGAGGTVPPQRSTRLPIETDPNRPYRAILRRVSHDPRAQAEILIEQDVFRIGRDQEKNHWSFPEDTQISRQHLQLDWQRGGFYIRDLRSNNGTWLNNKRLASDTLTPLEPDTLHRIQLAQRHPVYLEFSYEIVAPGDTDGLSPADNNKDETGTLLEDNTLQTPISAAALGASHAETPPPSAEPEASAPPLSGDQPRYGRQDVPNEPQDDSLDDVMAFKAEDDEPVPHDDLDLDDEKTLFFYDQTSAYFKDNNKKSDSS